MSAPAREEPCGDTRTHPDTGDRIWTCAKPRGHDGVHADGPVYWHPTPTPPRDDAGVEDVEELLSELARAAEDGQNSYERGDRLGQREAGNREDEARDAILAIVRAARQRITAAEEQVETMRALAGTPEPRAVVYATAGAIPAGEWPSGVPSPYAGGCTCAGKAPTVPVYRHPMTHLDDCPAKDSGFAVGMIVVATPTAPGGATP